MKTYVKFNYLYRDAGNYKSWGDTTFLNPDGLNVEQIDAQLRSAFDQEILFIAHQINIPDVFLYIEQNLSDDDHCFHEYDSVEATEYSESRLDERSINQFLEQVKSRSLSGWKVFNPVDELAEIRERSSLSSNY